MAVLCELPQVNVLWDLGPHDVSIFQYVMKREMPTKVTMTGQNVMSPNGLLDVVFLTLNYASGVIGQVHVSWVDPHKARDIVFVGTQARVVMNDMDPQESLRIYKSGFIVGGGSCSSSSWYYGGVIWIVRPGS